MMGGFVINLGNSILEMKVPCYTAKAHYLQAVESLGLKLKGFLGFPRSKALIFIKSETCSIMKSGGIQICTISFQLKMNNVCYSNYHSEVIISK